VAGTVARGTHQFVTLKHTFGIVLQERKAVVLLLLWETTGLCFASGGLGVCLRGGAAVTTVGVGLVVVAPPGCRTKSCTKRLGIQPCCSALLASSSTGTCIRLFGVSFFVGRSGTIRCAAAARGICPWTSSSRYLGKLLQRLQRWVFVRSDMLVVVPLSYRFILSSCPCSMVVVWL
jgi:hypothetical protein